MNSPRNVEPRLPFIKAEVTVADVPAK